MTFLILIILIGQLPLYIIRNCTFSLVTGTFRYRIGAMFSEMSRARLFIRHFVLLLYAQFSQHGGLYVHMHIYILR